MGRWIGVVSCDLVRRHSGVQPAPNLSHFRHVLTRMHRATLWLLRTTVNTRCSEDTVPLCD
jgi:hypothetical protein